MEVARFPWKESRRAISIEASSGMAKVLVDPESGLVLGEATVGRHSESLVAGDPARTIHPAPTLSATPSEAAEPPLGGATYLPYGEGS